MPTKGPIPDSWLPYMRIIEFIGVLVAIGVVLFDFLSVRPIDRAVRVATPAPAMLPNDPATQTPMPNSLNPASTESPVSMPSATAITPTRRQRLSPVAIRS